MREMKPSLVWLRAMECHFVETMSVWKTRADALFPSTSSTLDPLLARTIYSQIMAASKYGGNASLRLTEGLQDPEYGRACALGDLLLGDIGLMLAQVCTRDGQLEPAKNDLHDLAHRTRTAPTETQLHNRRIQFAHSIISFLENHSVCCHFWNMLPGIESFCKNYPGQVEMANDAQIAREAITLVISGRILEAMELKERVSLLSMPLPIINSLPDELGRPDGLEGW